ncbi:Tat pathway signal protein [Arthrobacter rhizosphaerae]|uniref:Tat pathway signal protein n=1 Tax=Arthrobacter rhizosphaerae TaxID=2855490 RepID=UPI001FF3223B|nr:Tat pathway signal protein [Arthrobacter rhizosphaerae]
MNPNQDSSRDDNHRPSQEPQPEEPQKDSSGPGRANEPATGQPEWKTSPADFTPDPSGSKAPPFQVPKPELRPELLNPQNPPAQSQEPQDGPPPLLDPFAREREREMAARKKRSQRRTVVVGLGVTALLAGTITAIVASNADEPDYAQVCFDEATGERVEDTQCNSSAGRGGGLYAWYFYSRGANVPPVGQNRTSYPNFTRTIPEGAKASTGYSTKGGTVSRGGFGSSSKGGSTGG